MSSSAFPIVTVMTFPKVAIGLWREGRAIQWEFVDSPQASLEVLLPRCFSKMELTHVKGIAALAGEGPFTAVRIGCAWAQGLAAGWGVPLYLSSFFDLFQDKTAILLDIGANRVCTYEGHCFAYDPEQVKGMRYVGPDFLAGEAKEASAVLYGKALSYVGKVSV